MREVARREDFVCPRCGEMFDYVLEYERVVLCYKTFMDGRYERLEEDDFVEDRREYACPECGFTSNTLSSFIKQPTV